MKKAVLLLGFVMLFALAACNNESQHEHVTVEFWHSFGGAAGVAFEQILEMWHESQDYITIDAVHQGNVGQLNTAIMAAAMANDLPHIALAAPANLTQYYANDIIIPLNRFMYDPEVGLTQGEISDIIPLFREAVMWGDQWFGIPMSRNNRILFYNVEMFDAAGLNPPSTWDELLHAAEVLSGDGVVGFGFENTYWFEFWGFLESLGGTWINETTWTAEFASPQGIEAARMIRDLADSAYGRFAGPDGNMSNVFAIRENAMYIASAAGIPFLANAVDGAFEWRTVPVPTINGVNAVNFAGSDIVMFDRGSDAERYGAWEFMKFIMSPEITAEWGTLSGNVPVTTSALTLPSYLAFLAENPAYRAAVDSLAHGFNDARTTVNSAALTRLQEALSLIMTGEEEIEPALRFAEDWVNQYLEDAGYR